MNKEMDVDLPTVNPNLYRLENRQDILIIELNKQELREFPNETFLAGIKDLMDFIEDESTAKIVVFKGITSCLENSETRPDAECFRRSEKVLSRISQLPLPTIAVIGDNCKYFSLQFALSCDFRIGTLKSVFSCPEIKQGYTPGMATFYLTKFLGLGLARRVIIGGIPLVAQKAFEMGLLDVLTSPENLEPECLDFAKSIMPESNTNTAYKIGRRLINESYSNSYETALGKLLATQHKLLNRNQGDM